jgi:Mrp family chromosome partitioning ATPase
MIALPPGRAPRVPAGAHELLPVELRELYHALVSRLAATTPPIRTLGLTSSLGGEGVSTVATQFACAAATSGLGRVLLVDANFARPSASDRFALDSWPGLAEFLVEDAPARDLIQPSGVTDLSVLSAGRVREGVPRLQEALAAAPLEALQEGFDLIVFDLPATREGPFAARIAPRLGGVLLVVEAESTPSDSVQREAELLALAKARLLGVVFNRRPRYVPAWLHRKP